MSEEIKKEIQSYDDKLNKLSEMISNMIDNGDPVKHIADMCMDVTGHWNSQATRKLSKKIESAGKTVQCILDSSHCDITTELAEEALGQLTED